MSALEDIKYILNSWLQECASNEAKTLMAHMCYGKMLRSKLILAICGDSVDSKQLAAVIELIQTASLLHDDVIDEATMRRSKPSMNAKAGSKNAIMVGDLLYAKAFYELVNFGTEIAKVVSESVIRLSNGEILDVFLSKAFNDDDELYMQMIQNKTASLIEACAEAAAILSGQKRELFRIYGRNLGLAFQIIDDILDITQNKETMGKDVLNDFKEGKCTLPYIYLYHSLGQTEKEYLRYLFGRRLSDDEQKWILHNMYKSNALDKSFKRAQALGEEALKVISVVKNKQLEDIIQSMIERKF